MDDYKELLYEIIFKNKKIESYKLDYKCNISLKSVRESIEPLVSSITKGNEYDYNRLMETIPYFYRDNYRLKHEKILCEDYYGDTYENDDNQINHISTPKEAEKIGGTEGLLYSMHNHPSGISFQSSNDIYNMIRLNEKYSITVARDGIMIVKNDSFNQIPINESPYPYTDVKFRLMTKPIENSKEYKEVVSQYRNDKITQMEFHNELTKINKKFLDKNRDTMINAINKRYEDYNFPIKLHYARIK